MNGFDNSYIIGNINEEDIKNTENFARTTLHEIINADEYSFYYGIFKNNVTKFKLLDGHKKQLKMIIEYYKMQNEKKRKSSTQFEYNLKKQKPQQKPTRNPETNIVHTHGTMEISKEIINVDLTEEKKSITGNITEWIKQKRKNMAIDQEVIEKIISGQSISVALQNNNEYEENNDDITENNIQGVITCFCKIRTKIFKTVLKGQRNKKWILSNYYRHLTNHLESGSIEQTKSKIQHKNNLNNYFPSIPRSIQNISTSSTASLLVLLLLLHTQ